MAGDLETAIRESMNAYREVLDEFAALRSLSLASSAEAIAESAEILRTRLEKACRIHLAVNEALAVDTAGAEDPMMREWQDLVMRVGEENRLLSGSFRGMMSVVADGLSRARGGRAALKGYKSGGGGMRGGRLRRTC